MALQGIWENSEFNRDLQVIARVCLSQREDSTYCICMISWLDL